VVCFVAAAATGNQFVAGGVVAAVLGGDGYLQFILGTQRGGVPVIGVCSGRTGDLLKQFAPFPVGSSGVAHVSMVEDNDGLELVVNDPGRGTIVLDAATLLSGAPGCSAARAAEDRLKPGLQPKALTELGRQTSSGGLAAARPPPAPATPTAAPGSRCCRGRWHRWRCRGSRTSLRSCCLGSDGGGGNLRPCKDRDNPNGMPVWFDTPTVTESQKKARNQVRDAIKKLHLRSMPQLLPSQGAVGRQPAQDGKTAAHVPDSSTTAPPQLHQPDPCFRQQPTGRI
jgi:hypothetical protein